MDYNFPFNYPLLRSCGAIPNTKHRKRYPQMRKNNS